MIKSKTWFEVSLSKRVALAAIGNCFDEKIGRWFWGFASKDPLSLTFGCMSHLCVKVSGFAPKHPGWNQMVILNWDKYSDHLACFQERSFDFPK